MKKIAYLMVALTVALAACDDTSWKQEIENLKQELSTQQKLLGAAKQNANIVAFDENDDSYSITFDNGSVATVDKNEIPLFEVGTNGNWLINGQNSGVAAKRLGSSPDEEEPDLTPTIVPRDGYWYIDGVKSKLKVTTTSDNDTTTVNGDESHVITGIYHFDTYAEITIDHSINYMVNKLGYRRMASERYAQALAPDESITGRDNFIRKDTYVSATFSGFTTPHFLLGRDRLSYCGYWLEITDDELKVWSYLYYDNEVQTLRHGLDIHDDLFVSIDYNYGPTATVTMTSGNKTKTIDAKWWGGGAVFAQNLTQDTINVELSFFPKGVGYSVWLIGDSYMNWSNATRWLYYLKEAGYNNWMADHIPGGGSGLMIASFKNTLKYGCPKYAVWAIGMNDRSDYATEPYPYWLKNTKEFVAVCQKSGITPILSTTPCVPGRDHKRKNEWVRNSGLRYIDFARAVAIDDGPTWRDGYIATDSVHPTALGAAAIARRALIDFPELTHK